MERCPHGEWGYRRSNCTPFGFPYKHGDDVATFPQMGRTPIWGKRFVFIVVGCTGALFEVEDAEDVVLATVNEDVFDHAE